MGFDARMVWISNYGMCLIECYKNCKVCASVKDDGAQKSTKENQIFPVISCNIHRKDACDDMDKKWPDEKK